MSIYMQPVHSRIAALAFAAAQQTMLYIRDRVHLLPDSGLLNIFPPRLIQYFWRHLRVSPFLLVQYSASESES